jgi:LuxR family transcriptional regulator, maltose regulon positive regulatory protein
MVRTLLRTKLHWPRSAHAIVRRTGLIQRIEQGIEGDLTSIIAPAGYGKTTLAAEWARRTRRRVAWLALDEYDNELSAFLAYIVAAVRTLYPDACPDTHGLLAATTLPAPEWLAVLFNNEIDDLPESFVLVIDDFHLATDPAIHQFVDGLLRHPPLQMHLLLASRAELPFSLGRLRANRRLTELRTDDLRFSQGEAETLLAQMVPGQPADPETAGLLARIEGWAAGLHLAGLAISAVPNRAALASDKVGSAHRFITDYLVEQVLRRQTPAVQAFLLRTSILDRITPALARAVVADADLAEEVSIATLAQAGLFLNILDEKGEWYAYHSLFRELLYRHLTASLPGHRIADLHRRAGRWFAQNGLFDEALQHAFAANDEKMAIQIVVDSFPAWLETDGWRTINRRIALFPAATVDQHPWLLMAKGHTLHLQSRPDAVAPLLLQAERQLTAWDHGLPEAQAQLLRGYLDALWSVHWSLHTDAERTKTAAQKALASLPEEHLYGRGIALTTLTIALQVSGEADTAEQQLNAIMARAALAPGGGHAVLRPLLCLLSLYFAEGHIAHAVQIGQALLHRALELGSRPNQAWAHLALGAAAYEVNDLTAAAEHFGRAVELRQAVYARAAHESFVGLALTHQTQGHSQEVQGVLAAMAEFHRELVNPTLAAEAVSLRRRIAVLNGEPDPGVARPGSIPPRTSIWYGWLEIPAVTQIRVALAGPEPADWTETESALEGLLVTAANLHKSGCVASLLALKAVLHLRRHDQDTALHVLRQALAIGEPRGLVRAIVDAGPQLAPLLAALAAATPSAYLHRLRAALGGALPPDDNPQRAATVVAASEAIELTRREREVLALLGRRQTDREIAETLVISPLTVRTHIENLSSKLSVSGRRAIVDKARERGLLA